jgi:CheY-like chemotaxis protein
MKRILVIDDDEQMRGFVKEALTRAGYEVLTAEDGLRGLQLFHEHSVDLVITDLFMPEKEGCETIVELRQLRPGLKIIAISGGSRTGKDCLPIARALGAQRTLNKPIASANLLEAVRQVLEDEPDKLAA